MQSGLTFGLVFAARSRFEHDNFGDRPSRIRSSNDISPIYYIIDVAFLLSFHLSYSIILNLLHLAQFIREKYWKKKGKNNTDESHFSLSLSFSLLNKTRIKWKWKSMIWRRRKNKKRQKGEQWRERDELSSQLNSIQRSLPPRWSHPSSYNLIGMRMPLLGGITPLSALESLLKTQ